MMNIDIRNALNALANSTTDDDIDRNTDALADAIIAHAGTLTAFNCASIMTRLRTFDPSEALCAAYIRDTIRDNTDFAP